MNALSFPASVYRHAIGLDSLQRFLAETQGATNFPPYNIEQIAEDQYQLTLAVAGFSREDITVERHCDLLTISGAKGAAEGDGAEPERFYVHQGISFRPFCRKFTLLDFVEVTDVTLENGLLSVRLQKLVPESARPKRIPIK